MRYLLALVALFAMSAEARLVTFDYQVPGVDCAGDAIDVTAAELYIDSSPIDASDADCPASGDPVDAPPAGAQVFNSTSLTGLIGSIDVDLTPGTYYARMRVQGPNGAWSNLSPQKTLVVPESVPSGAIQIRISL